MNFSGHIIELCKKVSKKVDPIIMRLRNLIPCSAKLTIYNSSILPYLTYCHLVWHYCTASDSEIIECLQECALRAVHRTKSASYQTLLKISGLPTLQNPILQDIAVRMYKVKNNLAPTNVAELFNLNNSCCNFGPVLWNRLNNKRSSNHLDFSLSRMLSEI